MKLYLLATAVSFSVATITAALHKNRPMPEIKIETESPGEFSVSDDFAAAEACFKRWQRGESDVTDALNSVLCDLQVESEKLAALKSVSPKIAQAIRESKIESDIWHVGPIDDTGLIFSQLRFFPPIMPRPLSRTDTQPKPRLILTSKGGDQ